MADVQVLSGLSCQQFINGQLIDGEGQQECIVNPANGETLIALTEASAAQVGSAVKAAQRALAIGRALRRPSAPRCCCASPTP